MATPANRVPVRVARGTLANLTASLADLKEGEVVYVTDEDRLYVKEGGVLVATAGNYVEPLTTDGDIMIRDGGVDTRLGIGTTGQVLTVTAGLPSWEDATGGGGGGGTLNDLTDVDVIGLDETNIVGRWATNNTVDAVPQADGEWMNKNYGEVRVAATDSDGRNIVDGAGANDWPLTNTTGTFYMVPDGNFALTTACTYDNTGEQTDYTTYFRVANTSVDTWDGLYSELAIYNTNPAPLAATDRQVLAWSDANSDWRPLTPAINDLSDVDTATSAPLDGQVLQWSTADSEWQPGTAASTLDELTDVKDATNPNLNNWNDNTGGTYPSANGQWRIFSTTSPDRFQFYRYNALGEDQSAAILGLTSGSTIEVSADNTNWTAYTTVADAAWNAGGGGNTVVETFVSDADGSAINALGETIYVRLDIPEYVTDGQVLTWVDANSQWEPADAAGGASTLPELTDVKAESTTYTPLGSWATDVDTDFPDATGEWRNFDSASNDVLQFYKFNSQSEDKSTEFLTLTSGSTFQVSNDDTNWITLTTIQDTVFSGGGGGNTVLSIYISDADGALVNGIGGGTLYARLSPPPYATDGQVLTWVEANSQWEPVAAGGGTIDSLGDVDTSTAAPTDGQALIWNNTDSEWQPGDVTPLTSEGDMLYYSGGAMQRLSIGTDGRVLTVQSGSPSWQDLPVIPSEIDDLSDVATNVAGDADYASVSLLLDGTDFVDKSSNALTVTNRNGATTLDTGNFKFSPSSYDFNNDAIEVDNDAALDLSTGDWTIEFWAYTGLSIGTSTYFFSLGDTSDTGACWALRWINGLRLSYRASGSTTTSTLSSTFQTWSNGTWYHIAVCRTGDNIKFFLDGVDITDGAATDLGAGFATDAPASSMYVGARKSLGAVAGDLASLDMEQFRITKGVARYTTSFTPPTEPYAQSAPAVASDGQVLTYVGANSRWEAVSPTVRSLSDFDGVTLEDGAGLIYDSVNGIFKQNQQASDVLSAMAYKFKNTLSGDPTTGHIALDNADPSLATEIRVHKTTTNGVDLTNIFSAGVGTAQGIYIQRKDNASEAHFFRTTGPATDSGTYMTVGVQHVSGTGTFTNNKVMAVGVYAKGESAALAPLSVPSTATDTGTAGDIRYDAGYVYICVAANTWKRAALTSW